MEEEGAANARNAQLPGNVPRTSNWQLTEQNTELARLPEKPQRTLASARRVGHGKVRTSARTLWCEIPFGGIGAVILPCTPVSVPPSANIQQLGERLRTGVNLCDEWFNEVMEWLTIRDRCGGRRWRVCRADSMTSVYDNRCQDDIE